MTKKQSASVIILSVLLTLLVVIFFGGYISAKLSTIPLLRKFNILNPQAPIVINHTDEVRISDSTDVLDTISQVKAQLSAIVTTADGQTTTVGTAVNLTSDGVFVTSAPAGVVQTDGKSFVVLNDGRTAVITQQVTDPATGLSYLKAGTSGLPVVGFGSSKNATPGDKLLFLAGSTLQYSPRFQQSYVTSRQADVENQIFNSDIPERSFGVQPIGPIPQGAAVFNLKGEVVGLWSGIAIIPSDVITPANRLYFNDPQHIIRPHFGFTYQIINKSQSALLKLPEGAQVVEIVKGSASEPSVQAGLVVGDVITRVNDQAVNESNSLEELLEQYKPLDVLKLIVQRNGQSLELTLTAGFKK